MKLGYGVAGLGFEDWALGFENLGWEDVRVRASGWGAPGFEDLGRHVHNDHFGLRLAGPGFEDLGLERARLRGWPKTSYPSSKTLCLSFLFWFKKVGGMPRRALQTSEPRRGEELLIIGNVLQPVRVAVGI